MAAALTETITWTVRARVERIVDGDTFVATLDLGWGVYRSEAAGCPCRVRILDYDSPERTEPDWGTATAALAAVIPPGTVVWVISHRLDSFGRALATVKMQDGTTDLLDLLPPQWRTKKATKAKVGISVNWSGRKRRRKRA